MSQYDRLLQLLFHTDFKIPELFTSVKINCCNEQI